MRKSTKAPPPGTSQPPAKRVIPILTFDSRGTFDVCYDRAVSLTMITSPDIRFSGYLRLFPYGIPQKASSWRGRPAILQGRS